jgi:hypothetical protein
MLLSRKQILAARGESTYGTFLTDLAAADAGFRCQSRALRVVDAPRERQRPDATFGQETNIPEDSHVEMEATIDICGKGATGVPLWASTFLPACGLSFSGATASQTTTQANWTSLSAASYWDGRLVKGRGILCNGVINLSAGKVPQLVLNGQGGYVEEPSDSAILSSLTITEAVPPVWGGTTGLTIAGGTAATMAQQVSIDLGNEVFLRPDPNTAGGYIGGWFNQRGATVTMDPEATLFAVWNWHNKYKAGDEMDMVITIGSAANNIVTITVNDLQVFERPTDGDRNGSLIDNVTLKAKGIVTIAFS